MPAFSVLERLGSVTLSADLMLSGETERAGETECGVEEGGRED